MLQRLLFHSCEIQDSFLALDLAFLALDFDLLSSRITTCHLISNGWLLAPDLIRSFENQKSGHNINESLVETLSGHRHQCSNLDL